MSDFRPATPSQPIRAPSDRIPAAPAPTNCTPIAQTNRANHLPSVSNKLAHVTTDNSTPGVSVDPIANTIPIAAGPITSITPLAEPIRIPVAASINIFVDPSEIMPVQPVNTFVSTATAFPSTPPVTYPPRDFSSLRSGTRNPWGSLRHRNRRSYPLHSHRQHLHSEPPIYPHSLHPEPPQFRVNPQLHLSTQPSMEPIQLFQIVQHPHSISPTKPKITKTILITTSKITKNTHTACCACGNTIPVYSPDQGSWRSMNTR